MRRRFIDIGANLTDDMYRGIYHGSPKHESDLESVLKRAFDLGGLKKIILTGGSLTDCRIALNISKLNDKLFNTVGVHPTRCKEFEGFGNEDDYFENLGLLIKEFPEKVVALGEMGLDYERTQFCDKSTQKKYFEKQLEYFGSNFNLPLFLHCRNSTEDLLNILNKHKFKFPKGGVIHSFDGSKEDVQNILDAGFYIGINGCSLKTESNLEVVRDIPIEKIMIETDCPWCEVRPSHAGYKYIRTKFEQLPLVKKEKWKNGSLVKSRNEPILITQILEVIGGVKEEADLDSMAEIIYETTDKIFFGH